MLERCVATQPMLPGILDAVVFKIVPEITREEKLEAAALHWERLAEAELEAEAWDIKVGVFSGGHSPYQFRAETYRRAAKALRIEKETGVAVCTCCFKPFGQGNGISRNH